MIVLVVVALRAFTRLRLVGTFLRLLVVLLLLRWRAQHFRTRLDLLLRAHLHFLTLLYLLLLLDLDLLAFLDLVLLALLHPGILLATHLHFLTLLHLLLLLNLQLLTLLRLLLLLDLHFLLALLDVGARRAFDRR